jgi:GT2 family glycosyltransferase
MTLSHLLKSTMPPVEVVVVDNAGDDDATAEAVGACAAARIVHAPRNGGFGAGMNLGASKLSVDSEAILFLTHECRLAPSAIAHLYASLCTSTSIGAVGPVLGRLSQADTIWSAGGSFTRTRRRPSHLRADESLEESMPAGDKDVAWLDGAALLVRRSAFAEVDGFREDYFLYWEDIDLCHQLRALGWRVLVSGQALAWQEPSMASPYLDARNSLMFRRRSGVPRLSVLALDQLLSIAELLTARGVPFRHTCRLVWARGVGLVHGLRGRLDPHLATYR